VATRRGRAGDVHDRSAVGHQRQQRLGQEERPLEVDVEQAVELILADGRDRVEQAVAGVVDQTVEVGAVPDGLQRSATPVAEGGEGRDLADVQLQGDGLAAGLLDLRRTTASAPSGWLL
jgi:hypothetical protein